jgi:septal ring factor EnvC (AmiA/AmiB activator)
MKRQTSFVLLILLALGSSAASGNTPSDGAPLRVGSAVSEFERLIMRIDDEQHALEKELVTIDPRLETVRKRILARGRAYYRHVHAGLLPVGEGFDALVDHAAKVERVRRALERDVAQESELIKRKDVVRTRLERLAVERAPLDIQREAMIRAKRALDAEEDRRAAFARAFETSTRPDYVAIYGADTGPRDGDTKLDFAAQKGRLHFPVAGRAEARRSNRHGVTGVDFVTQLSAAVRSVAAGHVVFADRYDAYGLTVIVDHGDRYYSVYANLGGTDARVGDLLAAGARIGTSSSTGKDEAVYFEIRRGSNPEDPGPWLGM